jgi:magnesium-transporting ATPase (P-type)
MDSEIVRLASMAFVGVCISVIYWFLIGIFTQKKWLKILISILMTGVTIYLFT